MEIGGGTKANICDCRVYFHNGDIKNKRLHLSKIKTLAIGEAVIELGLLSSARKTIAASCEADIQGVAPPITDEQQISNDNELVPLIINNPRVDENYVHDTVGTVPGALEDVNTTINPPLSMTTNQATGETATTTTKFATVPLAARGSPDSEATQDVVVAGNQL
jgi:hypothetical protein